MNLRSLIIGLLFGVATNCFGQAKHMLDSLKQVLPGQDDASRVFTFMKISQAIRGDNPDTSFYYAEQAHVLAKSIHIDTLTVKTLNNIADLFVLVQPDSAILYAQQAYNLATEIEDLKGKAKAVYFLGFSNYRKAAFSETIKNNEELLEINKLLDDQKALASTYNSLGVIHKTQGDYDKAVENYLKATALQEELGDSANWARSLGNLGNIYFHYGKEYDKALDYYHKAFEIFKLKNEEEAVAVCQNNIGLVYMEKKEYKKSLEYFNSSLTIAERLQKPSTIASTLVLLGTVHGLLKEYKLALKYLNKAIITHRITQNEQEVIATLAAIADIYKAQKQYPAAIQFYSEALESVKRIGVEKQSLDLYQKISSCYELSGDLNRALFYYKQYATTKDSTFTEDNQKVIREMQTKYETDKKEKEIKLQAQELQLKDLVIEKKVVEDKRKQLIIYAALSGLLVVLIFSVVVYRQFTQKKAANAALESKNMMIMQQNDEILQANEEIRTQNEEIEQQKKKVEEHRDEIFLKSEQIKDSIQYARRIQRAVLPPNELLENSIPDYFILYKPRDIVSGDFYWFAKTDNELIIAAADCTGHGVPGAFMSMLGLTFLNEIVFNNPEYSAANILEALREKVIKALRQTGKAGEAKDGMDIALVKLNLAGLKAQYAGAYNPLYIFREQGMVQVKADKMPIGIYFKGDKHFTNHEVKLLPNDKLYIFSDGFVDQFGGPKNHKFMSKQFKELLHDIYTQPMSVQHDKLDEAIEQWKGDRPQLDDILVMGIQV